MFGKVNKMKNLTKEELVKIALKQEEEITKIRGYDSGIKERHLLLFKEEVLIRCIKKNAKTFNLKTTL